MQNPVSIGKFLWCLRRQRGKKSGGNQTKTLHHHHSTTAKKEKRINFYWRNIWKYAWLRRVCMHPLYCHHYQVSHTLSWGSPRAPYLLESTAKRTFFLEIASQFDPLNTCSADTYEWGARLCKLANKNEILKTIRERKHKWVGRTIERRRRKRKGWWRRDSMRKLRPFSSFRWWERGEGEKSQPLTLALWRWLTSFLWDFLSRIFTLYSKGGWVS